MVLITMLVLTSKCLMGLEVDINMLKNTIKDITREMEWDMSIKVKVGMLEFQAIIDLDHHNTNNKMNTMILIMVKLIIMLMSIIKINQIGQIF